MCKTEQNPNETALLRKMVDGLKQEVEKVKSVVYASKEVLNLEEAAMFLGISKSSLYKMTITKSSLISSRTTKWFILRNQSF